MIGTPGRAASPYQKAHVNFSLLFPVKGVGEEDHTYEKHQLRGRPRTRREWNPRIVIFSEKSFGL